MCVKVSHDLIPDKVVSYTQKEVILNTAECLCFTGCKTFLNALINRRKSVWCLYVHIHQALTNHGVEVAEVQCLIRNCEILAVKAL